MTATAGLVIDITSLTVEGAAPADARRLRAMIEAALAEVAQGLAARPGPGPATLPALRLDLGAARDLMAPGAGADLARRLEAAIRAAWEDAG